MTVWLAGSAHAQINTGSDGHDGAFNPTQNTVIDMASHPDGIYQYTSVNIRAGVTVTFKPNANNTPVVWLVQSSVVINGTVDVSGQDADSGQLPSSGAGGTGGPGGFRGGNGGSLSTDGQGPGGGRAGGIGRAGSGSFGTLGQQYQDGTIGAGPLYGNQFLVPLMGGSGGGGAFFQTLTRGLGGGGGGGALLIAATRDIQLNGSILARGGLTSAAAQGYGSSASGGGGSGGAVRLIASRILGTGSIDTSSSCGWSGTPTTCAAGGGLGRVRLDSPSLMFGGTINAVASQGYQPIILAAPGQGAQLTIASVAGKQVAASPTGQLATPDVVIPAQQANPVPVVVSCANMPLNTPITVTVKPLNGTSISAVGQNSAGTLAASTATVSLNLPRGGGIIYATATIPLGGLGAAVDGGKKAASYAQTGLTTDGERFTKLEITAALGGPQQIAYVTGSGKRFLLPR